MSQVFISYRRADDLGAVGRIFDWLKDEKRLGNDGVFRDVEGIGVGENFYKRIGHALNQTDVLLAIIGPDWLETIPARQHERDDYVRVEIELAFERNIHVVPVLLGRHLKMPSPEALPKSISRFAFLNAVTIDPREDFSLCMERLLKGLYSLRELRESPKDFRNRFGIPLVGIRRGRFLMGATTDTDPEAKPNEAPEREVEIHYGIWIGKYPVTVEEYGRVMGRERLDEVLARIPVEQDHRFEHHRHSRKPITQVNWHEANDFCKALTESELSEGAIIPPGYQYRLPTEQEWEYACRAGTVGQSRYGELDQIAWTNDSGKRFADVGELQANGWGLHDMLGLVHEWCRSCAAQNDLRGIRGGSYHESACYARASSRNLVSSERQSARIGFRVVLGPEKRDGYEF